MRNPFWPFLRKIWPELESMSDQRRYVGAGDVLTTLATLPLALIGLVWLILVTDLTVASQNWPMFLIIIALIALYNQINYFIIIEIRMDRYGSTDGSLAPMIALSGVLLFGPTAIWLGLIWEAIQFSLAWRKTFTPAARWSLVRNAIQELTVNTLCLLVGLAVYLRLGGEFPFPGLLPEAVLRVLAMLSVQFFIIILLYTGYMIYHVRVQNFLTGEASSRPIVRFFILSIGLPYLAQPFAILAAGLYVVAGAGITLFYLIGLALVAVLARRLSMSVENSRSQSRQLEKLEQLGRAFLNAPPDSSTLFNVLEQYIPNMFPSGHISVWLEEEQRVFSYPEDWPPTPESAWTWLVGQSGPQEFLANEPVPWESEAPNRHALITTPIFEHGTGNPIGGICLELRALVEPWDRPALSGLFPAVQTLAAQIASALHQSEVYQQSLEYQKISQELQIAGQIQASFLPDQFPSVPGWQLAVTLLPARETSGDFFDIIQLSENRLGILVADVADKGVGPALYMALSRTLLRTYALDYEAEPEVVLYATNNRLLQDARANLFVTAFYAILDTATGMLTYCNAGHNPPLVLCAKNRESVQYLSRTGMAIGIEPEATWTQATLEFAPGDVILLYTDGIPDAQNSQGDFFEDDRILETAQAHMGDNAHEIQASILEAVQQFVGSAPQFDDITLMVIQRDQ